MALFNFTRPPTEKDVVRVARWMDEQLRYLETALNEPIDSLRLKTLHAEPSRPRDGVIVFADGTDWDPGSGEGYYGYYGSAWVKLG